MVSNCGSGCVCSMCTGESTGAEIVIDAATEQHQKTVATVRRARKAYEGTLKTIFRQIRKGRRESALNTQQTQRLAWAVSVQPVPIFNSLKLQQDLRAVADTADCQPLTLCAFETLLKTSCDAAEAQMTAFFRSRLASEAGIRNAMEAARQQFNALCRLESMKSSGYAPFSLKQCEPTFAYTSLSEILKEDACCPKSGETLKPITTAKFYDTQKEYNTILQWQTTTSKLSQLAADVRSRFLDHWTACGSKFNAEILEAFSGPMINGDKIRPLQEVVETCLHKVCEDLCDSSADTEGLAALKKQLATFQQQLTVARLSLEAAKAYAEVEETTLSKLEERVALAKAEMAIATKRQALSPEPEPCELEGPPSNLKSTLDDLQELVKKTASKLGVKAAGKAAAKHEFETYRKDLAEHERVTKQCHDIICKACHAVWQFQTVVVDGGAKAFKDASSTGSKKSLRDLSAHEMHTAGGKFANEILEGRE